MQQTALINQPGRHGDIIICLPIAKWLSKTFKVFWYCPKEYHLNFRNIDYCTPVESPEGQYDIRVNLCFGLVKTEPLHQWWMQSRSTWKSFIAAKYYLAGVPLKERWNLEWRRNWDRECGIYEQLAMHHTEYSVVHEQTWCERITIPVHNKLLFRPHGDFNIFDWYKILLHAKDIHCIDSSLANFVEVIPELKDKPKYYYVTRKVPNQWDRTILTNNWEVRHVS